MASFRALQEMMKNPDKSLLHGFVFHTEESPEVVTYAPFTLFPTPVPRGVFHQALAVQTHFNLLVDKISQDDAFLEQALARTIQVEDFTARLFSIYKKVLSEGLSQPIVLGINRSDYMLDESKDQGCFLRQIEINTIAAGAFGTTDHIPHIHRASILFLVGNLKTNYFNHYHLQNELRKRGISIIRHNFEFVYKTGRLNEDNRLFVNEQEVAVVFYRVGFSPSHYTEQIWEARLMMERSLAVKCPDIATHLAGTKKVQQELTRPGVLERFFPDQPEVVQQIRATFAGLYTLDMGQEGDQTITMAMNAPDKFVLKPQREGGGNNFFDADIVRVLEEVRDDKKRAAYILMDRIRPKVERNVLLRRDEPLQPSSVAYELGVFGTYLRKGSEMVLNEVAGHVMRTKNTDQSEFGIRHGMSVFDNVILY